MRFNLNSSSIYKLMFIALSVLSANASLAQKLFIERVFDETLAQTSYLIADKKTGEAIVIDPKRDIDTYIELAKRENLKIIKVAETHIHADFLSGARELAATTNAELLLSNEGGRDWQYQFAHTGLKQGDKIKVGKLTLEVMHTPGHTPESITFLLNDLKRGKKPIKAFTGDFVFVGDVGRPDLLEKAAGEMGSQYLGARQLYSSIQRFASLPDDLEIWPGHGAGSFCGKSLSSTPSTTLAEEKKNSKAFQFAGKENEFVAYILEGQPTPPKYFAVMKKLNKETRPLQLTVPNHPVLKGEEITKALANKAIIIDTRPMTEVSEGFIPNSYHIEGVKNFSSWMGSLISYDEQLLILAPESKQEELTRKLMRIGMDNIVGFIPSISEWKGPLEKPALATFEELNKVNVNKEALILDVRTETEFQNGYIVNALNLPITKFMASIDKLDKSKPVIVHCQGGLRSAMAYTILKSKGFQVKNYSGGFNDWLRNNQQVVKPNKK